MATEGTGGQFPGPPPPHLPSGEVASKVTKASVPVTEDKDAGNPDHERMDTDEQSDAEMDAKTGAKTDERADARAGGDGTLKVRGGSSSR